MAGDAHLGCPRACSEGAASRLACAVIAQFPCGPASPTSRIGDGSALSGQWGWGDRSPQAQAWGGRPSTRPGSCISKAPESRCPLCVGCGGTGGFEPFPLAASKPEVASGKPFSAHVASELLASLGIFLPVSFPPSLDEFQQSSSVF